MSCRKKKTWQEDILIRRKIDNKWKMMKQIQETGNIMSYHQEPNRREQYKRLVMRNIIKNNK